MCFKLKRMLSTPCRHVDCHFVCKQLKRWELTAGEVSVWCLSHGSSCDVDGRVCTHSSRGVGQVTAAEMPFEVEVSWSVWAVSWRVQSVYNQSVDVWGLLVPKHVNDLDWPLKSKPWKQLKCFPPRWQTCPFVSPCVSGWSTPAGHIQSGAPPCRSTGQAATPPWPLKTPWRLAPSRRRRSWRKSWRRRRRRRRGRMRSASPSREATAPPTHTTTPTPAHRRHPALSALPGAAPPSVAPHHHPPPSLPSLSSPLLHPHPAFPQSSVGEIPFAGDLYIL